MAVDIARCYAVNRSSNSIYYSDDAGNTWTEVASNVSTSNASDINVNPLVFNDIIVLNGAGAPTTPYLSIDGGNIFSPGANISGKEVLYASSTCVVVGGKRLKSNTGPEINISLDGGITFSQTIDTTNLYAHPSANFGSITVMSVDFASAAGGYIAIAGNGDNSNADQIISRTFDGGNTFPDSIILDGNIYGVVRCVFGNADSAVFFAAGEPSLTNRGKVYRIDKALTDIPVEVISGVTAGSLTNSSITKFFILPNNVNRDIVFFIDSDGSLYQSTNAGVSWSLRSTVPGVCVDIMAINPSTLLALSSSPNAIYKSIDAGATWTEILQPSWNNPEALAYNEQAACFECVTDYTRVFSFTSDYNYCTKFTRVGPICKPPYIYSAIDKSCATPGALRDANIIYSIDQSESITGDENDLFKQFLAAVTNEIADRLDRGSIEVAIVKWAEAACDVLQFTSDRLAILNQIFSNSIPCALGANTSHVQAFAKSARLLHAKSLLRPDAENIMIIFTDGKNNSNPEAVNLSDIGLDYTIPFINNGNSTLPNEFYELANDAQLNLAGVGLKIMVVVVGEIQQRQGVYEQFIQYPLDNGLTPYVSQNVFGNYYFIDGGEFTEIEYVANQIRLGLGSSIFPTVQCPEGCTSIPGVDGLGYCVCEDQIELKLCLYKLTDCADILPPAYTTDDSLIKYVETADTYGNVVTLQNAGSNQLFYYQPGCFLVTKATPQEIASVPESEIYPFAVVDDSYFTCEECAADPYIKFTNCAESTDIFYTRESVPLDANGQPAVLPVLTLLPATVAGKCWSVEFNAVYDGFSPIRTSSLPFILDQFNECIDCLGPDIPSYKCVDCENNLPDIYTESDLNLYVGQVGKFLQYPNVCWSVSVNIDPDVTFEDLTPDGVPFPTCTDCLPAPVITYTLTNCQDPTNQIATDSNLNPYIDQVVRLTTTGDTCWSVTLGSLPNLVLQPVSVSQFFIDCQTCYPQIYEFINCEDPNIKIYTLLDFSSYLGETVNLQEYPGICWTVGTTDDQSVPRQDVTLQAGPFADCNECLITYFQLTNCVNPNVFLISSTNLSIYMGRTVTLAGYPSLCFTVSEPKCDCILVSVNDINYTAYAQPSLFNGKKRYIFETESGDMLGVAWSTNPNQWELFDITTLETYGFSILDSVCPFSNFWTVVQGAPYIITSIGFCAERIFNVAPELDFDNCLPCIKCI
jgi:hypothetical protein